MSAMVKRHKGVRLKILVVGGAGYIGSVTAEHLLYAGHEVIVFDNLCKGHVEAVPTDALFVRGDMGNPEDLKKVFSLKPEAVMHFAALSLVGESVQKPSAYFKNNIVASLALIEAAIAADVNRFVFSSTAAVYGEPSTAPIDESFPLIPTNPYGESKLSFEKILKWYSRAYGFHYAALRYFNAAGATELRGEDHSPETHLIPLVLNAADGTNSDITIFGEDYLTKDGTCIRDYIHVSDLAEAHILALSALPDQLEQIYNLGSETGYSVKEVIQTAEAVTGKRIPSKNGARREGDPAILVASSARIKKALGWRPKRQDLSTIIADAWQWKCTHSLGYNKVPTSV